MSTFCQKMLDALFVKNYENVKQSVSGEKMIRVPHETTVVVLPPFMNICLFQAAGWDRGGQDGIMPLFLFRSAIVRRLWLDTRLLLASFLRRSSTVSRVWPWPLGLPTTLLGRSGRKLEDRKDVLSQKSHERSSLRSHKLGTIYVPI